MNPVELGVMNATPAQLRRQHEAALRPLYRFQDRLLRLLRRTCEGVAQNELGSEESTSYLFPYQVLTAKSISHAESVRTLLNIGRYGDASVILRLLLSDGLMSRYLLEFQDRIPSWKRYAEQQSGLSSKERRKLNREFGDAQVGGQLEQHGVSDLDSLRKEYRMFSEAAHPSLSGSRFYALRKSGGYILTPWGHYDELPSILFAELVLVHLDTLTRSFGLWATRAERRWARRLVNWQMRLSSELDRLLRVQNDYVEREHSMLAEEPR